MTYIMAPYDRALIRILEDGVRKQNRTGVDTLRLFGLESRYNISEHFPVITGREISVKSGLAELLWVLSGSTNNNNLEALGCNFWRPWVNDDFEHEHGFRPGDFGPVYGYQLRNFGGTYDPFNPTEGTDQLAYVLDQLKNNPDSRRIIINLWNPADLSRMRLPPCHLYFQLDINDGKLSGSLVQRSCDFPIGVPYNILFYSALIYLLANECNLKPHEFIHYTMDSHIYVNQIDAVYEYLGRAKPDSPKLRIMPGYDLLRRDPNKYCLDHFDVFDYKPLDKIKIPVAV